MDRAPYPPEARLYGRSASDDKAPIVGVAGRPRRAARRWAAADGERRPLPRRRGGGGLAAPRRSSCRSTAPRSRATPGCSATGPVHQSRRMQVYFGARGVTDLEITLYGPARPLHSGHYGNWAPNPAVELAHLVAALRDVDGRIQVAGFYDDVRPPTRDREAGAARGAGRGRRPCASELALARTEAGGARLVERILLPALNVRGLFVGRRGARWPRTRSRRRRARRSTSGSCPTRRRTAVREQGRGAPAAARLRRRARHGRRWRTRRRRPRLVRAGLGTGLSAPRAPRWTCRSRARSSRAVERGQRRARSIRLPTLGGSVGMELFARILDRPVVGLPIVNHDNNQHARGREPAPPEPVGRDRGLRGGDDAPGPALGGDEVSAEARPQPRVKSRLRRPDLLLGRRPARVPSASPAPRGPRGCRAGAPPPCAACGRRAPSGPDRGRSGPGAGRPRRGFGSSFRTSCSSSSPCLSQFTFFM